MQYQNLKKVMIAGVSLFSMSSAYASNTNPDTVNDVSNSQTNWAETRARLNANLDSVSENVTATAAAISNSFSAELGGKSVVNNVQTTGLDRAGRPVADRDPVAQLNLNATDQVGSITGTAAAIGNSASVTIDGTVAGGNPTSRISNRQRTFTSSYSDLNDDVSGVDDLVEVTSAAINNSFSADVSGRSNVNNFQDSWRNSRSDLNLKANDTVGSIAATSAAIGNSASIKTETADGANYINSLQMTHRGRFNSNLTLEGKNVNAGDAADNAISATSASIANSLSVEGTGSLTANNRQYFIGDSQAKSDIDLDDIYGSVESTTAALGNSASFDITDAEYVSINNHQSSAYDPTATANVNIGDINGDVAITSAGIANSLSVSTLPSTAALDVTSVQENSAFTGAYVDASLGGVIGNAELTAAAIGNSVSISNLTN